MMMGKPLLSFSPIRMPSRAVFGAQRAGAAPALLMTEQNNMPAPASFREAEVLGLKLMQEGNFEDAVAAFKNGLQLPGSRFDVVRTKSLSGPSPVGGSMGGFDSKNTQTVDEFEQQAAYYNMACAQAQLGNVADSITSLETAFKAGFDNFATVRGDPDLDPIKADKDFEKLMEQYEPKKGFNPFGLFGGK
eukprot:CAMPEP_0198137658 /NCGR_PEP_ID=MMETSP1443-20131203/1133_1 /TAXON_ID=186043 /ORGANISM="Entomoneis sp., Strain CCMP2396" /LENGTH=189 /DNA_ID=CAMNT_0043799165 /DNA_START=189 /DNA_END=758 /DNA_ORIENTATION=+